MIHTDHIERKLTHSIGGRVFATPFHCTSGLIGQCEDGLVGIRRSLPRSASGMAGGGEIQLQLCTQNPLGQFVLRIFKAGIGNMHRAAHRNVAIGVPMQLQRLGVGYCARLESRGSQPIGAIHQGSQNCVFKSGRFKGPFPFTLERIKLPGAAHLADALL